MEPSHVQQPVKYKLRSCIYIGNKSIVYQTISGHISLGQPFLFQITNLHGNRVMEVLFIDLGVKATVEVTALREIPLLAKELMIIPPQVSSPCVWGRVKA